MHCKHTFNRYSVSFCIWYKTNVIPCSKYSGICGNIIHHSNYELCFTPATLLSSGLHPQGKLVGWKSTWQDLLLPLSHIRKIQINHFSKYHCSTLKYYEDKAAETVFCYQKNLKLKHLVGCETYSYRMNTAFSKIQSMLQLVKRGDSHLKFRN